MRRYKLLFRAFHFYVGLGGVESCPHSHIYRVEVVGDVPTNALEDLVAELSGRLLNDWEGLLYPEPTTENLAASIFRRLSRGGWRIRWVSVEEDGTVRSLYDGSDVWVSVRKSRPRRTAVCAVKGSFSPSGFAANLKDISALCP
ncbi:MAG: hypothetical protein GXO29_04970 [Thermotogae bacterium]|nr:hypothetical protein [Thermotogota bacterium]